ncbi:MAG TPA: hypothetical protein VGO47_02010, partial [Chlamydiales bacterium]|nr:hypothetical protein [Chlamydiales bacterium]
MDLNRSSRVKEVGLGPSVPSAPRTFRHDIPRGQEDDDPPPVIGIGPNVETERHGQTPPRFVERYATPLPQDTIGIGDTPSPNIAANATMYEGVIRYVQCALQDNAHKATEKSALAIAGVKIAMPDPYSGSPVLENFEVFVAKVVDWLELHNLLRPGCEQDQVLLMGRCLEGEAATWYYDNVRCPTRINSVRWELETVV